MSYHDTPVKEFHEAFGHPVVLAPTVPPIDPRRQRVPLIAEELVELAEASGVFITIEPLDDGTHHVYAETANAGFCDLVECADALGDIRVLTDGGNLIYGFPGQAVLMEIHRSNMSKLGADGQPLYRADGKILKGPNYTPPNIAAVLAAYTSKVPA